MKKTLLIFLLVGVISCNGKVYDYTPNSISSINDYSVTIEEAMDIASSFVSKKGIISSTKSGSPSVKMAFSINDQSSNPLLHIINYEGGGFVIIAADTRILPIQGYSQSGYFSNNKDDYPLGLSMWIEGVETAKGLEKTQEQICTNQLAWMQYRSGGFDFKKVSTKSLDPINIPEEEVDTLVGPLITNSWHQYSPYNDSLNVCAHYYLNNTYAGEYMPAIGCVPLAIARILRYNLVPNNYSWSSMPNHVPQSPETLSFLRDVHYSVKSYAENHGYSFDYHRLPIYDNGVIVEFISATGLDPSFNIGSFLCNQYGFPAALTEAYSFGGHDIIRREIFDYQRPCIIAGHAANGGGHCWICDGYSYHYYPMFNAHGDFIGGYEYNYLHHRWGDENYNYDSWLSYNNFSVAGSSFQNNLKITHRISMINHWSDL